MVMHVPEELRGERGGGKGGMVQFDGGSVLAETISTHWGPKIRNKGTWMGDK